LAPASVLEFIMNTMLPQLPEAAKEITVLLQAKLDIVSELRWCMVDGELRGREWKSLKEPKQGQLAVKAGYQNQFKACKMVEKFAQESGKFTMEELETKMGVLCKKVYSDVVADAGGEKPLYVRVDLLLDKDGRVWLGERESWGADLNGNDYCMRMNPTYKELTTKMIQRTKCNLRDSCKSKRGPKFASRRVLTKFSSSSPSKRRCIKPSVTPSPSKRKCVSVTPSPSKRKCTSASLSPSKRKCMEP